MPGEAFKILGTRDLSDCVIYATCEPCPMCVGAIIWAGIKDVYFAATRDDADAHGFGDLAPAQVPHRRGHEGHQPRAHGEPRGCDALFPKFWEINPAPAAEPVDA